MGNRDGLDRRTVLRRVGAATAGVAGAIRAIRPSRESGAATPGRGASQEDAITRFRMMLPDADVFAATYVNLAVVVGRRLRPGEHPPPQCVPGDAVRLQAYDAAVADLTESSLVGGDGDAVGEVVRLPAFTPRSLGPGSAYRVVGGTPCDGYVRVTVHDLADQFDAIVDVNETDGG